LLRSLSNASRIKEVTTTHINVKVSKDVVSSLQNKERVRSVALNELSKVEKELDILLEPVHPGAEDPYLSQYFKVDVPDQATAMRVIKRLQNCKAIEAAYLKPSDELPRAADTKGGHYHDN